MFRIHENLALKSARTFTILTKPKNRSSQPAAKSRSAQIAPVVLCALVLLQLQGGPVSIK